ncbi:hypothetical protein [Herpetosiphon geysericola]|uniref:Uncharacterized protein n=1 Tax=Herpetosiphon geysericola TaxID=70996 RepID=A0A0P6XYU9_9CHLR|nr:hypothetical protein [Herpetosiphon geysericola]KPL90020.1 hypothetical protein SE18_08695 [Herpetosiphon geysericola]
MSRPPKKKYELGQWVRFSRIVAPKPDADGWPRTQYMGRVRKGMVIGVTKVYRRLPGTIPPRLADGVEVYLIAVSHHRYYRVFESDIKAN